MFCQELEDQLWVFARQVTDSEGLNSDSLVLCFWQFQPEEYILVFHRQLPEIMTCHAVPCQKQNHAGIAGAAAGNLAIPSCLLATAITLHAWWKVLDTQWVDSYHILVLRNYGVSKGYASTSRHNFLHVAISAGQDISLVKLRPAF